MPVMLVLVGLLFQSAVAGPLQLKIEHYEEFQKLLQRYCLNNPNSKTVKVIVNRTELSCGHLLVLASRLKSEIEDEIDDLKESCEEGPRPEATQLARQAARIAQQSVCRPQSTDGQCLESFACSLASQVGQSIPVFGAPITGMVNSCKGNFSAGGCIQSIAKGIFDSLWGLISAVWDVSKAAVRGVGDWIGVIEAGENSTSEKLLAAQRAGRDFVSKFVRHPIETMRETASALFKGLRQAAMESYGCEQWSDPMKPFVSRCVRPMSNWNCASCQQKFQVFCGIAGLAIGEIPSALLVGGVFGVASRIASVTKNAIRANARLGRVSSGVAEVLGKFRPPAGLSASVQEITKVTSRVLTSAERRAIESWDRLKASSVSEAISLAARHVPAAELGQAMQFTLRPVAFYVDLLEGAANLGFRAGDGVAASVIVKSERVPGSLTEIERTLPPQARAVTEVTPQKLRALAGEANEAIKIPEPTRLKIQEHVGLTEPQQAYLENLVRVRGDKPLSDLEISRLMDNPNAVNGKPVITQANRPFRTDKITSIYPEGVTPDDVIRQFNQGRFKAIERPVGSSTSMTPYEVELGGNRYRLYVCTEPRCEVEAGVFLSRNEVRTVYPDCGPGVRALLKLSKAKNVLRQPGPITADSFFEPVPCKN